jgi:endonuclease YncB( thermonuclease family)
MKRIFLLLFWLLVIPNCYSQISGKAVGTTDGDTFTLLTEDKNTIKVRLHGIDTPESKQDFGQRAKQLISDEIFGKIVFVKENGLDRYGRLIGIIYSDENYSDLSINEKLLRAGLAWHYKIYDKNPEWAKFEIEARELNQGLWSVSNPIAPWEFRKCKRN